MENRTVYLSQLEDPKAQLRLTGEYKVGLESYEFAAGDALDQLDTSIAWFCRALGPCCGHGLSLHGPFLDMNTAAFDEDIRTVTRKRYEQSYEAAKRLGADRIVYHSCLQPMSYRPDCWAERSIPFWKDFLKDKDDSISIHMENLYDEAFWPMKTVVEEVAHPAFSLCVDVGHANVFSRLPISDWLEGLLGTVGLFHLSNNDGLKDLHGALDCGTLDMDAVVEYIGKWYPDAGCTLEIQGEEAARRSLELLAERMRMTNGTGTVSNL